MKNLLLAPLLCICFFSQAQWNYVGVGTTIATNIESVTEDLLIGVGPNYDIQRSVDGGISWESTISDYEYSILSDIDFVDEEIGYICGGTYFGMYRVCLLKTIDAGQTWDTISANHHENSYMHNRLSFPTENLGFLTLDNGGILKTEDGGETFTEISFGESDDSYSIHDVQFLNENLGYASYSKLTSGDPEDTYLNRIYKTTDQGENWVVVYENEIIIPNFSESEDITMLFILDEDHIYGAGYNGGFIKSEDGGDSWEYSTLAPGSTIISALEFVSPEVGFCNTAGIMHRTEDGGETWTPQTTNPLSFVDDISMVDENIGYFVGSAQWGTRYVQKTSNAGGPLSIEEISDYKTLLYPNPTNEEFSLQSIHDLSMEEIYITDLSGRLVKNFNPNQITFNVSEIDYGNYIVVVKHQKGTFAVPLIIE